MAKKKANFDRSSYTAKDKAVVFGRSLCVGGVAAAFSKTAASPIERIKIILQVDQSKGKPMGITRCLVNLWKIEPANRPFYLKTFTYYRGNYANVIRYFPTQALNFAFKSFFKSCFYQPGVKYSVLAGLWRDALSGGMAGACGLCFVYPMDFARTRITSDTSATRQYKGMGDCIMKTMRNEGGVRALYKGFGPSVCGIFPYRALYFSGYDLMKRVVMKGRPEDFSFWAKWACSQTTSVFAQFCVYPLDTVRRRMQVSGDKVMKTGPAYSGSMDCFKHILKEEGTFALYKGFKANAVRATGSALCLVLYDSIGRFLFLDKDYGGK